MTIQKWVFLIILIAIAIGIYMTYYKNTIKENLIEKTAEYLTTLQSHEKERLFPYRYFHDASDNILPIVAVTGPFRDKREVDLFDEYKKNGIQIFGITAYKSFPKPFKDGTADDSTANFDFDYIGKIENWLSCVEDPTDYGFTNRNNLLDMSESDFYDADTEENIKTAQKKYDFIYVCLKDDDACPIDGWNATNRNFDLAKKCFPIMIKEYGLSALVVGRVNCGLEEAYGSKITVVDFLPYDEFQKSIYESRMLFVPNVADASPRVVSEAIIKDIPVIMNRNIICGSKYITEETGAFFTDELNIREALDQVLSNRNKLHPRDWWLKSPYGKKPSAKKLRNFLYDHLSEPSILERVDEVYFYL
jgi:hypothetical protein